MHDIGVAKTLIVWDKTRNSFYHKISWEKKGYKKKRHWALTLTLTLHLTVNYKPELSAILSAQTVFETLVCMRWLHWQKYYLLIDWEGLVFPHEFEKSCDTSYPDVVIYLKYFGYEVLSSNISRVCENSKRKSTLTTLTVDENEVNWNRLYLNW